ncbi:MAG: thiamine-phosphate kinase [Victivallaceae bacterium]|nr:thiamine-phosphate kinase [Victivallaceae bacterium]
MNEIKLLEKILPDLKQDKNVFLGPGDDCAALDLGTGDLLLAAVDQLISSVHYDRSTTVPRVAGAKLLKRNLSDIAAMGGKASWALLALATNTADDKYLLEFYDGLREAAEKFDISLCGGDFSSLPKGETGEVASLTILGIVERDLMCCRSGAQVGDIVFVTGALGNSYESGRHLTFEPRLAEGRFLATGAYVNAMIDISDGLLIDAQRLAKASEAAVMLELGHIPVNADATLKQALGDGEDYELLFCVPADKAEILRKEWSFETALTSIGEIRANPPGEVTAPDGEDLSKRFKKGYEH